MIYVDASALVALWLANDGNHERALAGWDELGRNPERLFMSSLVLEEVTTLVGRRAGAKFAAEKARAILDSSRMTILRPDEQDERAALAFFEKYADQRIDLSDAVSFVLMRKNRIRRAFTFDGHFELAGFTIWPRGE